MKYITIIDTDDYEDFEFFEDGNGKYIHGIDASAVNNEWILLYFKECEQEPRWIPVSEKLPEEYIACLCTIRNHETFNNCLEVYNHAIQYDPDSKEWLDEDMSSLYYEVIAWMPLPKPYEPPEGGKGWVNFAEDLMPIIDGAESEE